jgi:hypothetical protein
VDRDRAGLRRRRRREDPADDRILFELFDLAEKILDRTRVVDLTRGRKTQTCGLANP